MSAGNRCFDTSVNWKASLQQLAQSWDLGPIDYQYSITGPNHKQVFTCMCSLTDDRGYPIRVYAQGTGKKDSSTLAARKMFKETYD